MQTRTLNYIFIGVLLPLATFSQSLETVVQMGHELAVISVAVSPDSNYVATGSRDKSAKLWELSTGREVRSFLGHDFTVTSLQFSRDGKILLTGSNDGTVRFWEVSTGKQLYTFNPSNEKIADVIFSPDMKYFAISLVLPQYYNNVSLMPEGVQIYSVETKKKVADLKVDKVGQYGVHIAFSPDGQWLAAGVDDRKASVFRTNGWAIAHTFTYESGSCGGCATWVTFAPDSKHMIMASNRGPVRSYDLPGGKRALQYAEEVENISAIEVSQDGKTLLLATEKELITWDVSSGKETDRFVPTDNTINGTAFLRNGRQVLVASSNNTAVVWDLRAKKVTRTLTGFLNQRDKGGFSYDPEGWDNQIAKYIRFKGTPLVTPDGKSLLRGKFGTKVKKWDISSGKMQLDFTGHKKAVLCYDLSSDGKRLVTGGGDGRIIVWNTQTGDSLLVIRAHRYPILDIRMSSDGTMVAASSWDATLSIWEMASGNSVNQLNFENNSAFNIHWGPSDLYMIAGQGKDLRMWELDSRSMVRDFVGHLDVVSSIRMSTDRQQLLTASWDGTIRIWNIGTGLMTKKLTGHRGAVHTAIYSPDGRSVYSAGADMQLRVWDVSTSKIVRTFDGHRAEVSSLQFSPDGKMLISYSVDGVTKFWDLASGKEFFEHVHFGESAWMVKSPEGFFSGSDDARQFLHFVNGMKTYSVDQFFNEFYRPDLLPRLFQSRGGADIKGMRERLQKSPPPSVKIAARPAAQGQADVYVRITDNGGGVQGLTLLHNGKAIAVKREELMIASGTGGTTEYHHVLNLIGGTNNISAKATNRDNLESDHASVELFSETTGKSSTCFVLAVGINQYKNPKMTLNYARPDAESFSGLVNEKGAGLYKNIDLNTIYDADASRENILAKMDELARKIRPEDVFIFYYAGHGSMVDDQFYFIPTESLRLYDAGSLLKEAIPAHVFQEKLKNIHALKQLIIMDACQSGGSVELLATRGAAEEKAIAQLSRSAGIHVLASAGSEQFATEFAELGHGLFTYLLVKALSGDADGAPKDGKVTIYELKGYLDDQVPEMTRKLKGKPQYPYTFSRGQDFPIVVDN